MFALRPRIQRMSQMSNGTATALELRSLIRKNGELELSLVKVPVPEPGPDEVLGKVEASPINTSDLGLLVGPPDMSKAKPTGSGEGVVVRASLPSAALPFLAARLDQSMPVRNGGAGTVVKAGSGEAPP